MIVTKEKERVYFFFYMIHVYKESTKMHNICVCKTKITVFDIWIHMNNSLHRRKNGGKKEISRTSVLVHKQNRNNYFMHRIFLYVNFVKQSLL